MPHLDEDMAEPHAKLFEAGIYCFQDAVGHQVASPLDLWKLELVLAELHLVWNCLCLCSLGADADDTR